MRRTAHRVGIVAALLLWILGAGADPAMADSVVDSKHNLSVSGPGAVRAQAETRVCIFCHAVHNASPEAPLWNRGSTGQSYAPYLSASLDAIVGQPTGSSKLCLSCHDGTIALGAVLSRAQPIAMLSGADFMPPGRTRTGTDLSDDHPISFAYDGLLAVSDGQLKHPGTLVNTVTLDAAGQVQCRSCHDPHDNQYGKFLVMANVQSALCLECHNRFGWDFTPHKLSSATWNGAGLDPWPTTDEVTVADNACANCHQPHSAPGRHYLMHAAVEEDNCFACHTGNVAALNVQPDFFKPSHHPVEANQDVHEPHEDPLTMPMHAECTDCHEPHVARNAPAGPPNVPGAVEGSRGLNTAGQVVARVNFGYEVCFKCHADNPGRTGPRIVRQVTQTNVRLEFGTGAVSSHPVTGTGASANVPSLLPPYSTASIIACTDCHGSDSSQSAGGTGPNGPHGSVYTSLLERRMDHPLGKVKESPQAYALCYKCHSRASLLSDDSFGEHQKHMDLTGCLTCHDPHGIAAGQGNPTNNSRLINFDIGIVQPGPGGLIQFVSEGLYRGNCTLTCHGKKHDQKNYVGRLAGG